MITNEVPNNWHLLQKQVAKILKECGFKVEEELKVYGARSSINIDVFAEEKINDRTIKYCIECKYWKRPVPQSIIQGFRTIIDDIGANVGYVISLKGFQKGARDSSKFTNIQLLTWNEFQEQFLDTWINKYFVPKITESLDELFEYTEIIPPSWFRRLSPQNIKKFTTLWNKYFHFSYLCFQFSEYGKKVSSIPKLPLSQIILNDKTLLNRVPIEIINESGYREFLDLVLKFGGKAIEEFRDLKYSLSAST